MRLLIVYFKLFLFLSVSNYGYSQSNSGLVAHWNFEQNNGKVVKDIISGKQDSIHYVFNEVDGELLHKEGIGNNGLVFDGFSTWVKREANSFTTPSEEITISVWIAPRTFEHGDGNKLSAIVNQQDIISKQGFALGIYRHGSWSFQFGTGDGWVEIWDNDNPIPRRTWTYLAATYDAASGRAVIYMNGEQIAEKTIGKGFPINKVNQSLIIGKHNQAEPIADNSYQANMFNGIMDELKIYNRALTSKEIKKSYDDYLKNYEGEIHEIDHKTIMVDRSKYKNDPYRPEYHATPPGHWMNEPHAPFYYNGKYHLFYQYNPTGPYWHHIHWGHWVSEDMVHWKDLPYAIYPENDSLAPDGIWSGGATYDKKGTPVVFPTFGNWSKVRNQGAMLAHPADANDSNLTEWVKYPEPIVEQMDNQGLEGEFRDPFVWKDEEEEKWYMLIGSGVKNSGGTAMIYSSQDLYNWSFKGRFYLSDYKKYPYLGEVWELPILLPVGKYPDGESRYIFLIDLWGSKIQETYYWIGRFDKENYRFLPDQEDPQLIDLGGHYFVGPAGFVDPRTKRTILFSLVQGGRGKGWAGNMGLPLELKLDENGLLNIKPIRELTSLREEELISFQDKKISEANKLLRNINGDLLEVELKFEMNPKAGKYGIKVRKSSDGEEETRILYDENKQKIILDRSKSSLELPPSAASQWMNTQKINGGEIELNGEELSLHIFLDKSMLEVYVNQKNSITSRLYPQKPDSKGLVLLSDEEIIIKSMKVWKLSSIY